MPCFLTFFIIVIKTAKQSQSAFTGFVAVLVIVFHITKQTRAALSNLAASGVIFPVYIVKSCLILLISTASLTNFNLADYLQKGQIP